MQQLESSDQMEAERSALSAFQDFFDKGQPVCGHLQRPQLEYLFGPQAEDTRSAALIPLRAEGVMGMLAIGSRNAERFHPAKGTEFLVRLGERDILSVLLEGGAMLGGSFLRAGLVDRVMAFIAPVLLGGDDGFHVLSGPGCRRLADASRLKEIAVRRFGDDIMIEGEVG